MEKGGDEEGLKKGGTVKRDRRMEEGEGRTLKGEGGGGEKKNGGR